MDFTHLRTVCLFLAVGSLLLGGLGMAMSFVYLTSASPGDVVAAGAGFVAGSILVAAGLVSLALLSGRTPPAAS